MSEVLNGKKWKEKKTLPPAPPPPHKGIRFHDYFGAIIKKLFKSYGLQEQANFGDDTKVAVIQGKIVAENGESMYHTFMLWTIIALNLF